MSILFAQVIVTSATFDTQVFAQYFALPVGGHLEPAPVIQVGTVHHQVSEFFADDLTSKLGEVCSNNVFYHCIFFHC